jgi:hypothetical protein
VKELTNKITKENQKKKQVKKPEPTKGTQGAPFFKEYDKTAKLPTGSKPFI